MARPRRRHAATAPLPASPTSADAHAKLFSFLREKWLELGGLVGACSAVVGGLGLAVLRSREDLLGLSPGLNYPTQEWAFAGLDTLKSLLWRGLSVLASDYPVLRNGAWGLALLCAAVWTLRRRGRPGLLFATLALSAALLAIGTAFYRIALGTNVPAAGATSAGFRCAAPSANLADRASFEICTWLMNDSPQNEARRSDLNGILGWLLAASSLAAFAAARARLSPRPLARLRWPLAGFHALLALLLLGELPRAYAIGTWGWSYPQVKIDDDSCKHLADLARASTSGHCRAFDVSAGADKKMIYVTGAGCPPGLAGHFRPLQATKDTDGSECLATLSSPPRVIFNGS